MSTTVSRTDTAEVPLRHRWSESSRFLPRTVVRPAQRFMQASIAGAVVMVAAALVALLLANSPWSPAYGAFWRTEVVLHVGSWDALSGLSLRDWVNDGAMTTFFFVVALEIKREVVAGELRAPRAAALPILAAVGGMVVPALIYATLNAGKPGAAGWGIPMATDIAFAVAVVTAAGNRVPPGARLMLLSLAIVDDLGAIVVIAVFYTQGLSALWLAGSVAALLAAWLLQRAHVRAPAVYVVLAVLTWYCLFQSGVHPTLAGVAFGFLTPAWSFYDPGLFSRRADEITRTVAVSAGGAPTQQEYEAAQSALRDMRRLAAETQAPLERLEWRVAPWVTFLVLPVFAFANGGLALPHGALTRWLVDSVSLGVVAGLVIGKPVGIMAAAWIATRTGLAVLPTGTSWRQLLGVAACGGVGFTVALFVSNLAFNAGSLGDAARLGILVGSLLSGAAGLLLLRTGGHPVDESNVEPSPRSL
jgi:NhaA family Na+:H+ antiporter